MARPSTVSSAFHMACLRDAWSGRCTAKPFGGFRALVAADMKIKGPGVHVFMVSVRHGPSHPFRLYSTDSILNVLGEPV